MTVTAATTRTLKAHGATLAYDVRPGRFLGGEYGWPGEPDAFAAKLRDVLEGR